MANLISVIIGSNHIEIIRVDPRTKAIISSLYESYDNRSRPLNRAVLKKIYDGLDGLPAPEAIGVGASGFMDQNRGVIKYSTTSNIKNLRIVELLGKRYRLPVSLYNVSVASVIGEKLFGFGKGYSNVAYVSFSTVIRAGIVAGDHVLLGKDGNAHEVGHLAVSFEGNMKCTCGSYGHWDAYCSGYGIPRYTNYLLDTKYKGMKSKLRGMGVLDSKKVYAVARTDHVARRIVLEDIGRLNAIGIANIINAYDPEIVILGGVITNGNLQMMLKPILRHVGEYLVNRSPRIVLTRLKEKGKIYGSVSDFL